MNRFLHVSLLAVPMNDSGMSYSLRVKHQKVHIAGHKNPAIGMGKGQNGFKVICTEQTGLANCNSVVAAKLECCAKSVVDMFIEQEAYVHVAHVSRLVSLTRKLCLFHRRSELVVFTDLPVDLLPVVEVVSEGGVHIG